MTSKAVCEIPIECKGDTADVLIYDQIGSSFFEEGLTAKAFAENLKSLGKGIKNINVRINSPGGSVFDGTAIYNTLRNHGAKVVTHIEGGALSIASLIAMAGDERRMAKNGYLMIHDPASVSRGTADAMRKTAAMLDKVKATLVDTYSDRSGHDKEDIAQMMTSETWLTAKDAKELGFIDTVTDEAKVVAAFDPQSFSNVPTELLNLLPSKEPAMSTPAPQPELPKAATLKELRAACPGADEKFLVAQLENDATVASAQIAWMTSMAAANAAAKAELETVKAELAEAKKAPPTPAPVVASGVDPLPVGNPPAPASANAKAEFNEAVAEHVKAGLPRDKAVSKVVKEQPAIYNAMLAEANKGAK